MNKSEIVNAVADATGITKAKSGEVFDAIFDNIKGSLSSGNEVRVPGIGTLVVKERKATTGRNPQTGAEIKIPASKQVKLRVAKALKEAVN